MRWMMMATIAVSLSGGALPSGAQESASYQLKEHVFNAGGHPDNGTSLASTHYQIRLDAIGDAAARSGLTSASYRMEAGFVVAYPPPGEVANLRFADDTTLMWQPEPSIGSYALYRALLTALSGGSTGDCSQFGLTGITATDAAAPPVGNGFFYLVTARNRLAEEGTKGFDSAGAERPNPVPCP